MRINYRGCKNSQIKPSHKFQANFKRSRGYRKKQVTQSSLFAYYGYMVIWLSDVPNERKHAPAPKTFDWPKKVFFPSHWISVQVRTEA